MQLNLQIFCLYFSSFTSEIFYPKRAQKYRFYPTDEQAILLAQTFGCARGVYSNILRWRTDTFYKDKQKIGYTAASSKLTALKKEPEFKWLNDISCVPLQQKIRDQQTAFSNFLQIVPSIRPIKRSPLGSR
jgi:putative transposase